MAFNRRRFLLSVAAAGGLVSSSSPGLASTLGSPVPLQGGVRPGDWPFSTSDIRGTRSNPHESIIGPGNVGRLKVKWTFDGAQSFNQTTPSVVGNTVYFPANDGYVYAVDARSGALRWKCQRTPFRHKQWERKRSYCGGFPPAGPWRCAKSLLRWRRPDSAFWPCRHPRKFGPWRKRPNPASVPPGRR